MFVLTALAAKVAINSDQIPLENSTKISDSVSNIVPEFDVR